MSKTSTGLLAVAIVGGAFAVVAVVGVVVMTANNGKPDTNNATRNGNQKSVQSSSRILDSLKEEWPGKAKGPLPIKMDKIAEATKSKIKEHRYWDHIISDDELYVILYKMCNTTIGHEIDIGRDATSVVLCGAYTPDEELRKFEPSIQKWQEKHELNHIIEHSKGKTGSEQLEATAKSLLASLDYQLFRDGEGR